MEGEHSRKEPFEHSNLLLASWRSRRKREGKDLDPYLDSLAKDTDPRIRIRIRTKMSRIQNTGPNLKWRAARLSKNIPSFFKGAEQADGWRPWVDGHHWGLRRVPHREGEELLRRKPRVQPYYTILQVMAFRCQLVCYNSQCAQAPLPLLPGWFYVDCLFFDVACRSFVKKNKLRTLFPDVTDMQKVTLVSVKLLFGSRGVELCSVGDWGWLSRVPGPDCFTYRILKLSHLFRRHNLSQNWKNYLTNLNRY